MCQSDGILPCFQQPPVTAYRPIAQYEALAPLYVPPMLRLSDDEFPISLEERARRGRAELRHLGITTPDVED